MAGSPLTSGQQQFVSQLSAKTGLNPGVVTAWVLAEESGGAAQSRQAANNHDWLNIGYTDSGTYGNRGSEWSNPVSAASATAAWLHGQNAIPGYGRASGGVQSILRAGSNPQAQIQAIQHSGWASSGYPDLPTLYGQYANAAPRVSAGTAATVPALPGLPQQSTTTTQQVFDQQGFDQQKQRYILGQFLKGEGKSAFDIGPKVPGLSSSNPLFSLGVLPTSAPNAADFTSTRVIQTAQNALQKIAGGAPLNVHSGATPGYKGYVNPLPGFSLGRTDMGVDANAAPGTPIRAIGDSKVVAIRPNWYAGQPYVQMQLLNGPKAGQYWYVAEQVTPHVRPGQVVHAGDTIGTYAPNGTGIEIGWGSQGWQTLAQAQGNTGDASHNNAPAGVNFHQFLNSLGAH